MADSRSGIRTGDLGPNTNGSGNSTFTAWAAFTKWSSTTIPATPICRNRNQLVDQKLVIAHVYGHGDFFKNNLWFSQTNRKMMDEMANHATRIRRHIEKQGYDTVEKFLDVCLSLEDLIDPHSMFLNRGPMEQTSEENPREEQVSQVQGQGLSRPLDQSAESAGSRGQKRCGRTAPSSGTLTPARPTRDVLLYLLQHARLEDWQIDCLSIVREEAYYFAPQGMTKVMNEGWASYWHSTLMTKHFVEATEIIDYADHHSGTVHMPPGNFNPYKIGLELFRDIEDRWNKGNFGKAYDESDNLGEKKSWDKGLGLGREKIFEVRRMYNDVNFIDEFMTPEFIEKHKFYQYGRDPHTGQLRIVSRDPAAHQADDAVSPDQPRPAVHLCRGRQLLQPRRAVPGPPAQRPGPGNQIRRRNAARTFTKSGSARCIFRPRSMTT